MSEERKCKICGCKESETPKFYPKSELCNRHYIQMYRHGCVTDNFPRTKLKKKCDICGDTDSTKYKKWHKDDEFNDMILCTKHFAQLNTHGCITDYNKSHRRKKRICEICGSDNDVLYCREIDKMTCRKHYSQVRQYGKIFDRTVFDRND